MSRFKTLSKLLGIASEHSDDARKVLEKIDSPELAVSLKGKARDEYIQALTEIYGNKLERAEKMGFDFQQKYYHGSPGKQFDQFDLEKLGKNTNHKSSRLGVWVSPDSEVARNYTYRNGKPSKTGHIRKMVGRFDNPGEVDFRSLSSEMEYLPSEDLKAYLQQNPEVDALTIRDSMGELDNIAPEGAADVTLVRAPEKLRDVNAAFDPRFKNSAKLMAGAGAIPMSDMSLGTALEGIKEHIAKPVVSRYEKIKSYFTEPLAKELDLTKDKSESKTIKKALDLGLDPLNVVDGPLAIGAGALQLLGSEDEDDE